LRFGEALGAQAGSAQATTAELAARISAVSPDSDRAFLTAQSLLARVVGREAVTIAFDDIFRIMAWMFLIALVMVPFCKVPKAAATRQSAEAH
jgi:DHA2 family multidrug resistance protein